MSQIMIDKLTTVRRDRVTSTIGQIDEATLQRAGRAVLVWLGVVA